MAVTKQYPEREPCLESAVPMSVPEFLQSPSAFPDHPQRVEVCETHISWVFLTDTRAYKLKKPVKFDFLDFGTPELRRKACEDELTLNRRLAPDIYLEVLSVASTDSGQLALNGEGVPIDWVVEMRRLPNNQALDVMIAADEVCKVDVDRIAERLTLFYEQLPAVPVSPEMYRREINGHVRANRLALLELPDHFDEEFVRRVHTAQLRFLHVYSETFDERVRDGRIVEGHGDLKPEHIYLAPKPVIIDCIEFNAEFRQLDVLDELCFLAMECAHQNADWIGEQIIQRYCDASGDRPSAELQAFYTAYRACVRAKVSLLRASQLASSEHDQMIEEAARYLHLADEVARELGPPSVLIVRGPSGVGKTTLATTLADTLGLEHLQTDAVRRELFGASKQRSAYNEGSYSAENRRRVYQVILDRTRQLVSSGLSVVLDGTFLTHDLQRQAVRTAESLGAQPLLINCFCPPETATQRIDRREQSSHSLSDAQPDTHRRQTVEQEYPQLDLPQCRVDTRGDLPTTTHIVLDALKKLPQ